MSSWDYELLMQKKLILDLCGGTGAWSKPYADDPSYEVVIVDPLGTSKSDVRLFTHQNLKVHGILAAPPCTHFSGSGARWWKGKGDEALLEGLSVVDACMRIIKVQEPVWWCLENPVGRLNDYLGKPRMYMHPCDFAGYSDDPDGDNYTKKTALWGVFKVPRAKAHPQLVAPDKTKIHWASPGPDRWKIRSVTPQGFARAFKEANP